MVLSDTHHTHKHVVVLDGDVLIHCGGLYSYGCAVKLKRADFTNFHHGIESVHSFNRWLGTLPHARKIVIAGNHETSLHGLSKEDRQKALSNATYLEVLEYTGQVPLILRRTS